MVTRAVIQMVDLKSQYLRLKTEIDAAIAQCLEATDFINGSFVKDFQHDLAQYLQVRRVISCANGTDALQLAMMGLGLRPGDEVVVPAFTYVATAETIALLGLTPIWVDVDPTTFTLSVDGVEAAITPRTKAIVPVHLFGQCADMEPLLALATARELYVIEDVAQALGSQYYFSNGSIKAAGTMGTVGCTSFFPSKNLGCYGDGGALITNNNELADRLAMIANHGQRQKYVHELVGINSRLDTVQAAILTVKLKHLTTFNQHRQLAADYYDLLLKDIPEIRPPVRTTYSTHVYHQYTIQVLNDRRDALQNHLKAHGISSMVYYPIPMHQQPAYSHIRYRAKGYPVAESLCRQVLSLPMHTELTAQQQEYIVSVIADFMFN